jgi:large subunit ribosomal protein L35
MPKLKTHKATSKRYKKTSTGKIIKRTSGQNHFNARENGKVGRNKKSDVVTSTALNRIIGIALPHNS